MSLQLHDPVMVLLADRHQSACMINYVIVTVVLYNKLDFVPLTVSNAVHALGLAAPLVDDLSPLGRLALLFLLELLGGLLPQQKLQCAISKKKVQRVLELERIFRMCKSC